MVFYQTAVANHTLSGQVVSQTLGTPLKDVQIYNQTSHFLTVTDSNGYFEFKKLPKNTYEIILSALGYETIKQTIYIQQDTFITFKMMIFSQELPQVVINEKKEKYFSLRRLNPVEKTAIYAGKKTEVIVIDQLIGNTASNNARQIYSQIAGLNIYESTDAGLQLNIGGRGLDPSRTANFNTRQNDYDISADVLGYPESYYTPPVDALSEIQIIRGAASLQYGTQFGGLINFKMKKPSNKKIKIISRHSYGSFDLINSFNSISGTKKKFSFYCYYNFKKGNGFRPNTKFHSSNLYGNFQYSINEQSKLSFDITHLNYLAQQPGGLTDTQFNKDPSFSNRSRNWFQVNWNLYALNFSHKFSEKSEFSIILFALQAKRYAIGFRSISEKFNINPISQVDEQRADDTYLFNRNLIKGKFKNGGAEIRWINKYQINKKNAVLLIGSKMYKSRNTSQQGQGNSKTNADFSFHSSTLDSDFVFPNTNFSLFTENIFFVSKKLSITPGVRFEYIQTKSLGTYRYVATDLANNIIFENTIPSNQIFTRSLTLFGIGFSYHVNNYTEGYANASQNYRSVTFNDIRTTSPSFVIDPNITDENGYTFDIGLRGKKNNNISYDLSTFGLLYNNRIGIIVDNRAKSVRKNIGTAFIYGLECFIDMNFYKIFFPENTKYKINGFINLSITHSQYIQTEENNVLGNEVELIPLINLKTGMSFGYNNFMGSILYTYLTKQFTDAENSPIAQNGDRLNGIIGIVPAYNVVDLSLSYSLKNWTIETGINNLLNNSYFTRRATGYPGPGIIPSEPRTFYITLQFLLQSIQ